MWIRRGVLLSSQEAGRSALAATSTTTAYRSTQSRPVNTGVSSASMPQGRLLSVFGHGESDREMTFIFFATLLVSRDHADRHSQPRDAWLSEGCWFEPGPRSYFFATSEWRSDIRRACERGDPDVSSRPSGGDTSYRRRSADRTPGCTADAVLRPPAAPPLPPHELSMR